MWQMAIPIGSDSNHYYLCEHPCSYAPGSGDRHRMRQWVDGMTRSDNIILEALAETGFSLPPKVLAVNTEISPPTVQRRLSKLEDAGLVEQSGPRGYRRITEFGRRYLNGEISDEEIAEIELVLEG